MRPRWFVIVAVVAFTACASKSAPAPSPEEQCKRLQPRYRDLVAERFQEARERVPATEEDDQLTTLNLESSSNLMSIDADFLRVCPTLPVAKLAACVDAEVARFATIEKDEAALRRELDVRAPWIIKSPDPACQPIFAKLEAALYR